MLKQKRKLKTKTFFLESQKFQIERNRRVLVEPPFQARSALCKVPMQLQGCEADWIPGTRVGQSRRDRIELDVMLKGLARSPVGA